MSIHSLTHKPKVIFCDVDKTLTVGDVWYGLTSALHGDVEKHFEFYSSYQKGLLTFEQMKQKLFDMWITGYNSAIPRRVLEDIFFKVSLRGETFSFFIDLRNRGYKVCLISNYMDIFVRQVAQKLQIEDWYASAEFLFDKQNNWVDYTEDPDERGFKVRKVEEYLKQHSLGSGECVVLGSGHEEIDLFRLYPGIAVDTENEQLKELAWREIKYLPTVLQLLNQFE